MRLEGIPEQTLRRLPLYLEYINTLPDDGHATISANDIASALKMGEVKVRKDLAVVSTAGRPKVGYLLADLRRDLRKYLGCEEKKSAVLVGAGCMGSALLADVFLRGYGLQIVAAFDRDKARIGTKVHGVPVLDVCMLRQFCELHGIRIGILTVPPEDAQQLLDDMVQGGVKAVWSFVPRHLTAPEDVLVQEENMNGTLALLTQHVKHR